MLSTSLSFILIQPKYDKLDDGRRKGKILFFFPLSRIEFSMKHFQQKVFEVPMYLAIQLELKKLDGYLLSNMCVLNFDF